MFRDLDRVFASMKHGFASEAGEHYDKDPYLHIFNDKIRAIMDQMRDDYGWDDSIHGNLYNMVISESKQILFGLIRTNRRFMKGKTIMEGVQKGQTLLEAYPIVKETLTPGDFAADETLTPPEACLGGKTLTERLKRLAFSLFG